jgi:DsbC/DsbD-like thiol-disulfide interchange protein
MIRSLALAACLSLAAIPASATTQADILAAEVLTGWRTPQGTHMAALRLRLAPEWKTYWRAPGDAGIPPLFDWSASDNLQSVRVHWPSPQVFHVNGMQTIGYRRELVLPVEITPRDASRPIRLRANVDLGVCRDICMPAALELSADLPAIGGADPLIRAALEARPSTGREAGLTRITCAVEPIADGLRLTATLDMPSTGGEELVVVEPGQPSVWAAEAVMRREGNRLTATTELVATSGAPFALDRSSVTVTVLGSRRTVEIRGCPGA